MMMMAMMMRRRGSITLDLLIQSSCMLTYRPFFPSPKPADRLPVPPWHYTKWCFKGKMESIQNRHWSEEEHLYDFLTIPQGGQGFRCGPQQFLSTEDPLLQTLLEDWGIFICPESIFATFKLLKNTAQLQQCFPRQNVCSPLYSPAFLIWTNYDHKISLPSKTLLGVHHA